MLIAWNNLLGIYVFFNYLLIINTKYMQKQQLYKNSYVPEYRLITAFPMQNDESLSGAP